MKHKHYDLIVAWANGAEIEARYEKATGWTDWKTEEGGFIWYIGGAEYRIKPEPKPDVVEYLRVGRRTYSLTFEWSDSPRANLKLIYDGETGDLKSAEVIK